MDLKKLTEPFDMFDIEWRPQQIGESNGKVWIIVLAYVTNRAIMERLDEVCGADKWKNQYKEWHGTSQLCGISIKIGEEWVTKWDGADATNMEATKGGLSDSMKRAGVQWGIGRYLYKLEQTFAQGITYEKPQTGDYLATYYRPDKNKPGKRVYYLRPKLPKWALTKEQQNASKSNQ